jgi:hypothetical protein
MGRKPKAAIIAQAEIANTRRAVQLTDTENMTPELRNVVGEIDQLFEDVQVASLNAYWNIGRLITEVQQQPDTYLTDEQRAAGVDGASLLLSVFSPLYSADQLRGAISFYEKYQSEAALAHLLELRCPDRPRWRITTSHVQLLAQITDDTQRQAIEEKCAEEAYTAKTLANELQELRGKQKNSGRTHQSPKGLKQQIFDLLQHQRRFIARSETLWLNEKKDNIYDDIVNAPVSKIDETIQSYIDEVVGNFDRLSDIVADHIAMCRKISEELSNRQETQAQEEESTDVIENTAPRRSSITR